ncbi:2'-hydroxybiphenyl-2-sulfinate desulfinase [compost metagenome]|uniref:NMT1/THI5 like family protein n=1 Tax=Pseudomonas wadenswilerensis TaxID=1785161 RepID=A0A380T1B8_9PSED|nr:ABC transporter substrate-binding protein [Pseudomonas wadenswilerensis]SUQ63316.1 NMT1/THI5 like family protein [Pseudomonas wadenswilerensis]
MNTPLDTLWYTRCPVPTGLGIAVQQGWLQDSLRTLGTQVQSIREADDAAVRESHFDHSLRHSVRHGGSIPAIWARAQGRATRLIGLSWADEAQLILTRADSGIHSIKQLAGKRFGLPDRARAQIDFTRAQALRGLENALKLDGLQVGDLQLVNYRYDSGFSDSPVRNVAGSTVASSEEARNLELIGLLRGEVDAIFLKGASAVQQAHDFGLRTLLDVGAHPDPLIRSNNGTPRTLSVDQELLDQHLPVATQVLDSVLRAEAWAHQHPEQTRRYLALETNSSEYWVSRAYGEDAHKRLHTTLDEQAIAALQDFVAFLQRWRFIRTAFDVRQWIDRRPMDGLHTALAG